MSNIPLFVDPRFAAAFLCVRRLFCSTPLGGQHGRLLQSLLQLVDDSGSFRGREGGAAARGFLFYIESCSPDAGQHLKDGLGQYNESIVLPTMDFENSMDHCANAAQHWVILIGYLGQDVFMAGYGLLEEMPNEKRSEGRQPFSLSFIFRALR
jgi:hypothetical protein